MLNIEIQLRMAIHLSVNSLRVIHDINRIYESKYLHTVNKYLVF